MAEPRGTVSIAVGDVLPELVRGPIDRKTLALFAGASHDHVPLHIDTDFARAAGMDDVFAHGMLGMAYLAQMLTRWAPQGHLRSWNVRFTAITPLHARSEEHTSELQSLMRISYAVFCLKKKKKVRCITLKVMQDIY